jgi:hypothetical protein
MATTRNGRRHYGLADEFWVAKVTDLEYPDHDPQWYGPYATRGMATGAVSHFAARPELWGVEFYRTFTSWDTVNPEA